MGAHNKVAFFDVDGTLLLKNSGTLYAKWLHRQGLLSSADMFRALLYALQYHFNMLNAQAFWGKVMQRVEGESLAVHMDRGREFYDSVVAPLIRPSMLEALRRHQQSGDTVAILTASTRPIVEPLAEQLEVEHLLCTELAVDDVGTLTGRLDGIPCYGDGKLVKAQAFCQQHGLTLENAVAYADSMSDRHLLEAVSEPIVVSPDPLLKRYAKKRAWVVVH